MSEAPSEAPPAVVCGGWAQQASPLLINGATSTYSIKTQHQPHAVVSPGLSEPRLAAAHREQQLLTSTFTQAEAQWTHPPQATFLLSYFLKWIFEAWPTVLLLAFAIEKSNRNTFVFHLLI